MKKIITKLNRALQVVLLVPIKWPGKAIQMLKYIALGLGVVETVLDDPDKQEAKESPPRKKGTAQKKRRCPMKGNDIRIGTLGGTLCSIYASFSFGDLLQTALMAVVGTAVSYLTSRLLGKVGKRRPK